MAALIISGMDMEDLRQVQRRVAAHIGVREREPRFGAWMVMNWHGVMKRFKESQYLEAAEFVLAEARRMSVLHERPARMHLHLEHRLLPESEYRAHFPE